MQELLQAVPLTRGEPRQRYEGMGGHRRTSYVRPPHDVPGPVPEEQVAEPDAWAGEDDRWAEEDRAEEEMARALTAADEEDLLAPARALVVGLLLVVPIWLAIFAVGYLAYRLVG